MKIQKALFVPGYSSFYFDDQKAIKEGAGHDGFVYVGKPVTQGFTKVRQGGECVSVLLVLDNGAVAVGDCAAVQYSGAGGRDPLFLGDDFAPFLEKHVKPLLEGRDVGTFLTNARYFDTLEVEGKRLHTAIRYGLTRMVRMRPYLAHGILELDNNTAERGMRAIALGRKNYLFVGSEAGGNAAAIAYTLIETAKLNAVDPHAWLADTLARIPDYKITKVDNLLPWRWNG